MKLFIIMFSFPTVLVCLNENDVYLILFFSSLPVSHSSLPFISLLVHCLIIFCVLCIFVNIIASSCTTIHATNKNKIIIKTCYK